MQNNTTNSFESFFLCFFISSNVIQSNKSCILIEIIALPRTTTNPLLVEKQR